MFYFYEAKCLGYKYISKIILTLPTYLKNKLCLKFSESFALQVEKIMLVITLWKLQSNKPKFKKSECTKQRNTKPQINYQNKWSVDIWLEKSVSYTCDPVSLL